MLNIMKYQNDKLVNLLGGRYELLKGKRGTWETHWQEIADVMHPFDDNFVTHDSPGSEKMTYIFDSTPIHANQLLSAGLFSMLTNPAQKWFELRMMEDWLNQKREVMEWHDLTSRIMYF